MIFSYYTVKNKADLEIVIKKSRFIAHVAPVDTAEKAEDFISEMKSLYKDATHNVYAYLIGNKGLIQKASDDGEPSGTAGRPVLDVIKNKGLQDVVVVVTRYFGGKLLGAGGLIRAYSQSAAQGIEAAKEIKKVLHRRLEIVVDYPLFGILQRRIEDLGLHLENIEYTDVVTIKLLVKETQKEDMVEMFINLTNAQAKVTQGDSIYLDFPRYTS
jgi:uncharacterized YigZ family protein